MITTLDLCDDLGIAWETLHTWHGPIWTGERFMFAEDSYGDVAYFHELCHWFVADEWQIKCPDLGLGRNVNSQGDWTSHLWPVSDTGGYTPYDLGYESWCGEDRVTREEGGYQEALAVSAMGLYAIINPDEEGCVQDVMNDFGAWQPPGHGVPWTPEMNQLIVDLIAPCLDIDPKLAFEKMEYFRTLHDDDDA